MAAGAKELELEIDVTYEEEDEVEARAGACERDDDDTAVMPLVAIRELLRQEALFCARADPRASTAAGKRSYVTPEPAYRIQEVFAKSR